MIGQVLGHYRIDAKLGEGGMGVVYRARDEFLHRDVALKVLSKGTVPTDSARDYLLHEARSSSALSHPNICTIYDVSELNGELYIVMELVEGKPLNTLIVGEGLPVESVLRYGVQIAAALSHSHSRSIIHRDLKSSNIVVTPEGLVKVLDFGIAKRSEKDLLEGATQTIGPLDTAQGLTSTLQFMAPEMLRGLETDHRIDIWALGVRDQLRHPARLASSAPGARSHRPVGHYAALSCQGPRAALPASRRSAGGARSRAICEFCFPAFSERSTRAHHHRPPRHAPPRREKWRRPPTCRYDQRSFPFAFQCRSLALGCGRSLFPWPSDLRAHLRRPRGPAPVVGRHAHLLGHAPALQR